MAEELNQHVSSQPVNTAGTNDAGAGSQPVVSQPSNMTDTQSSDYYNKTQQLAQQRREFEVERSKFEQERSGFVAQNPQAQQYYQNYYGAQQPYNYQQPAPGYNQPDYPSIQAQQSGFQNPTDPQVFQTLVKELGFDAANATLQTFKSFTEPIQQQLNYAAQAFKQSQTNALIAELKATGREKFGEAFNARADEVIQKIIQYNGLPLEEAWTLVNSKNQQQAILDAAYKNQTQKENGNVATQGATPATVGAPVVNDFGDAFRAALQQHGG